MAHVTFVKKARKDYPDNNIKKGDSYYWWSFRFGEKYKSKTAPSRSQLTQSSFLATLYDLEDGMSTRFIGAISEDLPSSVEELISEIEQLKDECQDSLDNMPDHLQDSSESGMLLQERIDGLESWSSDLENIDVEFSEEDYREQAETEILTEEEKEDLDARPALIEERLNELMQTQIEEIISEIEDANPGVS